MNINQWYVCSEHDDPSVGKPLLEREKEALSKAQNTELIDIIKLYDFLYYEILEFIIETIEF